MLITIAFLDDTVDSGNNESNGEDFDTANEEASDSNDIIEDSSSDILEDNVRNFVIEGVACQLPSS